MGTGHQLSQSYQQVALDIEARLKTALAFDPALAHARVLEAMAYATLNGGKRLRGVLAVASGDLCAIGRERSVTLAAGIECLHAYTLIHDDLPCMDDSDLRRGQPSVHRAFDEATAVLAGDGLQALAFELAGAAKLDSQALIEFAQAVGRHGTIGGQMQDMLAEAGKIKPTLANLKALHAGKTGALIKFSALCGPYFDADREHYEALSIYGENLGLAFQIWDDILDVEGNAAQTGKPQGHDASKLTFTNLQGLETSKKQAADLIKAAQESLPPQALGGLLEEIADFAVHRCH